MSYVTLYAQGGWGEYGRNSTLLVYGEDGIMLDCGINISALVNRENHKVYPIFNKTILNKINLRGVLLSHAHLDHIAAIPHFNKFMSAIYYGSEFTNNICKKLNYNIESINVEANNVYELGPFKVTPILIQHSIPGSFFYNVRINNTTICYASDFKVDFRPVLGAPTNLETLKNELGVVDYFIFDTTRAYSQNRTHSETYVADYLREELVYGQKVYRNIFYACFASHIARIKTVIQMTSELGYEIYILGRTFPVYLDASGNSEIYRIPSNVHVHTKNYGPVLAEINKSKNNLVILSGVNAEPHAVLTRLVDNVLKYSDLHKDLILLGGSEIESIKYARRILINKLKMLNVDVNEVHASGHSSLSDIIMLISAIKPKNLLPTHSSMSTIGRMIDKLKDIGYSIANKFKFRVYILENTQKLVIPV